MSRSAAIGLLVTAFAALAAAPAGAVELVGRAVLQNATFAFGPTSGQFITTTNAQVAPFLFRQPVQGFSAVLPGPAPGTFLVMPDNGYGAKANSADFLLRFYSVRPVFKTTAGGNGRVSAADIRTSRAIPGFDFSSFVQLRDPAGRVNFPIVADQTTYPPSGNIPVDPAIKNNRFLTGADFDIESFRRVPDGTYWFGDEFGPFLLHVSATGEVLDPPIQLPNFLGLGSNPLVQSPSNPLLGTATANLPNSRGFEGTALSADGTKLFAMLEGALNDDPIRTRLLIHEFDLASKQYTGRVFPYRMEDPSHAMGDLTAINDREFLIIERDNLQGDPRNPAFTSPARFKRIYKIDISRLDAQGFVEKTLLVDLLNIPDPNNLGDNGTIGGIFTFPFQTIEDVLPVDNQTLLVVCDNNFPFSVARTPGRADDNEFILVRLDQPLNLTATGVATSGSTQQVLQPGRSAPLKK